ncbi:MAG: hypothetical protein FJ221_15555 [Lentisphaerae bacterium]|nr:hypothetical protein [Lentisphaerota bacterium]
MQDRANITSIEAIESFRNGLVAYREKACAALDEAGTAIQRFKDWVRHDRKPHWQMEVRARGQAFEEARQAWFASRLLDQRTTGSREVAYKRARHALREAEEKLAVVKKWGLACDGRIDPLARELDAMAKLLAGDVARSIAQLAQIARTLGDYAGLAPVRATGAVPASADAGDADDAASAEGAPP